MTERKRGEEKRHITRSGLEQFTKEYKTRRAITVGSFDVELKKFLETPIIEWLG